MSKEENNPFISNQDMKSLDVLRKMHEDPKFAKKVHDSYLDSIKDYAVYKIVNGEKIKLADTHEEYLKNKRNESENK